MSTLLQETKNNDLEVRSLEPRRRQHSILIICVTSVIIMAMGIAFYGYLKKFNEKTVSGQFEYENNVTVGLMPGVDRDAFLAEMQNNVDESAIAFSINGNPIMAGSQINLLFENPTGNRKDLVVEILDNKTGNSLFKSKSIKEGSYLKNVNLAGEFEKGKTPATVYITAYHTESHEMIGQAAVEIIIDVS